MYMIFRGAGLRMDRSNSADNQPAESPGASETPDDPNPQEDEMITQFADAKTSPVVGRDGADHETVDRNHRPDRSEATLPRVPELSQKLEKDLVQIFKLLADETRLKILFYLGREKELHVSALCERLGQSQPAVSHHLALLRVAGLIDPRRDGKHNYYSVQQGRFHELMEELFQSFTVDSGTNELRFDDFIFRQDRTDR
jgi:ArsR family transcriptional regulator, arsenate/arsenite/antimonite-responsive transcriptional repressor